MKAIGRCAYCGDPIYDFQSKVVVNGKKHHKGCWYIKSAQEA